MKVTMLTTLAGANGTALAGSVLNLPDDEAKLLLSKNESGGPWAKKWERGDDKTARHQGLQRYQREDA